MEGMREARPTSKKTLWRLGRCSGWHRDSKRLQKAFIEHRAQSRVSRCCPSMYECIDNSGTGANTQSTRIVGCTLKLARSSQS